MRVAHTMAVAITILLAVAAAPAQERERQSFTRMLNTDALIDNYAKFLARKYDLTEEQDSYTHQLLREKAKSFLDKHQGELFDLVDRLFEVRGGAEIDQQELVEWGKRVLPIYEEAKQVIVAGNDEWREILTEQQRKIHDEDLRQMNDSFRTTEEQIQRITNGDMTIDEFRQGNRKPPPRRPEVNKPNTVTPQPASPATPAGPPVPRGQLVPPPPASDVRKTPDAGRARANAPRATGEAGAGRTPGPTSSDEAKNNPSTGRDAVPAGSANEASAASPRPDAGARRDHGENDRSSTRGGKAGAPAAGGKDFESQWEVYVRQFIEKYKLNEEQTQKANTILKDCQEQAARHINARKGEIERLDKQIAALGNTKDKDKLKELTEIKERRTKLMDPVNQIFEKQLKPRLDKLPTRAQVRAAEVAAKKGGGKSAGKDAPKDAGKDAGKGQPSPGPKHRDKPAGQPGQPPEQPLPDQPDDQAQEPPGEQPQQPPQPLPGQPPMEPQEGGG